jgi:hypothetical protein
MIYSTLLKVVAGKNLAKVTGINMNSDGSVTVMSTTTPAMAVVLMAQELGLALAPHLKSLCTKALSTLTV